MRNWLYSIRKEKNLSYMDAAKLAGVTERYYRMLERNDRSPHVKLAKKIAEKLGFDWKLFYEDGEPNEEN